jgi:iron complex transport system permease protein
MSVAPMSAAVGVLAAVLAAASLFVGQAGLGVPDPVILWELRAPRTLLALAIGGGLGLSGAVLQGLLRNRLADPGLLGVTAVASLTGAAVAVALSLAPNPFALAEITIWLLGSLEDRGWREVLLAVPAIAAGGAVLLGLGRRLDALTLGEAAAASLGVDVAGTVRRAAAGAALAVGAGAAVAGGVGFVGLIVPNLLRAAVGERPGALLLPSLLGGGALVLAADLAVRLIPLQQEMRLGVITALIGAPLLLRLAVAHRGRP